MESKRNRALGYGVVLMILVCVGCAHPLKTCMNSNFDPVKPMRVAVLPFEVKKESQAEGAQKIRRAFAAHLQESNLDVADIAYVDRILEANGWQDVAELRNMPTQELGESLGVDAVIFGKVTSWDKLYVLVHAHSAMAARADMMDARTGKWLWSSEKDAIHIRGILKMPVIIFLAPIPATQFALEGFRMDETTDDMTREMTTPLVEVAREGPSYAQLIRQRPEPLSTEKALALQKTVLEPERFLAEAEEPSPEPLVLSVAPGEYAVQVCATLRRAGARELVASLQEKGYPAYMTIIDLPGMGTFHRVRIRGFSSRDDARSYGIQLSATESLPFWVDGTSADVPIERW